MISKKRISAAFAHVQTDRVPIDFGGHRSSGIAAQAYIKLREHLGLTPSKLYIYDFIQQLAIIEDSFTQGGYFIDALLVEV
jgi:uroporphyrinogen decarboxylase